MVQLPAFTGFAAFCNTLQPKRSCCFRLLKCAVRFQTCRWERPQEATLAACGSPQAEPAKGAARTTHRRHARPRVAKTVSITCSRNTHTHTHTHTPAACLASDSLFLGPTIIHRVQPGMLGLSRYRAGPKCATGGGPAAVTTRMLRPFDSATVR